MDPGHNPLFPTLSSTALDGRKVTLPDDCTDHVTLVFIAFRREAQSMIDSWAEPFDKEFGVDPRVLVYEVPMIGSLNGRLMGGFIDAGMRSGIPDARHPYVVTWYGNSERYSDILGMDDLSADDLSAAYLFLLDKNGRIRWRGKGFSDSIGLQELIGMTRTLLSGE